MATVVKDEYANSVMVKKVDIDSQFEKTVRQALASPLPTGGIVNCREEAVDDQFRTGLVISWVL